MARRYDRRIDEKVRDADRKSVNENKRTKWRNAGREKKFHLKDNFRPIRLAFSPLRGGRWWVPGLRSDLSFAGGHPRGLGGAHVPKVGLP